MLRDDSEIPPDLFQTIEILEELENLIDRAPDGKIETILLEAWLKISRTFPEDFQDATRYDASAEGLKRYLRVKAFFANPSAYPISHEDLEAYHRSHTLPNDDSTEFFFPE